MKISREWLLLGALALAGCGAPVVGQSTDTNQVSHWCQLGVKYEPVSTPFVVPSPPGGTVWTKLILKAGSGPGENQVIDNPVVGQSYTRTDGKSISHVILCKEPAATTTTSTSTTSTTSTTTTSTTTSTTVPETTTTRPPCVDCTPNTVVITTPPSTFPPDTPPVAPSTTVPAPTPPAPQPTTTTTDPKPPAPITVTIPATR